MNAFSRNPLWFYLIAVNLYVLALMGWDKYQAKRGGWRVPEANLMFMGAVAGGIGGFLGMYLFHHKTRKLKFKVAFTVGIVAAILLIAFYGHI